MNHVDHQQPFLDQLSWSMLGQILLTIIGWPSCPLFSISLYHQPTSSDLYQTSIGIHPPIPLPSPTIILVITITNQNHTTPTAAHPGPHRLQTHSKHIPCCTSITSHITHVPEVMSLAVMVRARSRSFRRTIKGRLRRSLR